MGGLLFPAIVFVMVLGQSQGYPICGGPPLTAAENNTMNTYVDRLLWTNESAAFISIQLTNQERFFTFDQSLAAVVSNVQKANSSTPVGVLSYHLMAILSSCNDPQTLTGRNLSKMIEDRLGRQFHYKEKDQRLAFDGWYQYGLALQALCVAGEIVPKVYIRKALKGQNTDGGWSYGVDETSHMLLGLLCIKDQYNVVRNTNLNPRVANAINRSITYLQNSVNSVGNNVFIGNEFSTPEALLALCDAAKYKSFDKDFVDSAVQSILKPLTASDKIASIYQRLPVFTGNSFLSLKNNWVCNDPRTDFSTTPTPPATTTTSSGCPDYSPEPGQSYIDVTILVNDTKGTSKNIFQQRVENVRNGSTLLQVMKQAQCTGTFRYTTRKTNWGASVVSINGLVARSEEREYWSQRDGATGASHSRGVSSYIPVNNELLLFILATW